MVTKTNAAKPAARAGLRAPVGARRFRTVIIDAHQHFWNLDEPRVDDGRARRNPEDVRAGRSSSRCSPRQA